MEATRWNPALFAEKVLGVSLQPWQKEACDLLLRRMMRGEVHHRVLVRTCHGAGKTFLAAVLFLWFMTTRNWARGVTTAPKWAQVNDLLWPEIRKLHAGSVLPGLQLGEVMDSPRYVMGPAWFGVGAASDKPHKLEGHHSPTAACLIVDEAKGVADATRAALQGLLQAPESLLVAISTPWIEAGWFYDMDVSGAEDVIRLRVDIDRLIDDGVESAAAAKDAYIELFGSEDDPEYRARAKAEYISAGAFGEARSASVDACMSASPSGEGRRVLGLDPARNEGDGDEVALAIAQGVDVVHVEGWHSRDLVAIARRAAMTAREWNCDAIRVDAVGLGSGIVDILRAEGWEGDVEEFVASGSPWDRDRFANQSTEAAKEFLDRINAVGCSIPLDQQLRREILQVQIQPVAGGKMKLDKAPTVRGAKTPSPNRFDACMIATARPSKGTAKGSGLRAWLEKERSAA